MAKTHNDFLKALRIRESGNNYGIVNKLGYLGAYQFGEQALATIGYYKKDGTIKNDWKNEFWTGKDGISSKNDFLINTDIQDKAVDLFHAKLFSYIQKVVQYDGQTLDGIKITTSSLIAGAHLVGNGAETKYLLSDKSGDAPRDGNAGDTHRTSITEYWKLFSGYQTQFEIDHEKSEEIKGSRGKDFLYGKGGNDKISGNAGDDLIDGGSGSDHLDGGLGSDTIEGGAGNDTIIGGVGKDKLSGGSGKDTFVFKDLTEIGDTIADFNQGQDKIAIDAKKFHISEDQQHFVQPIYDINDVSTNNYAEGTLAYSYLNGNLYIKNGGKLEVITFVLKGAEIDTHDIVFV